jgi:endonuclease YncB( thermonuclease family)
MLVQGFARIDNNCPNNPYLKPDYDYMEREAQDEKEGLWMCDDRLSDVEDDLEEEYVYN